MSDYKKFLEELRIQVAGMLGAEYVTGIQQVTKANTGTTDALIISRRNTADTVRPVCCLAPLFREYRDGRSVENIAGDILEAYHEQAAHMEETAGKLGWIADYGHCREKIYFRMVNTEKNRAFLEDKVHFEVLDLSMVFYILVSRDNGRTVAVAVQKKLSESWGIPAGEIRKQAEKNTPGLFPARVQPLVSIMKELLDAAGTDEGTGELQDATESRFLETEQEEPFMMTNAGGLNGFSVVLYPQTLKNFSDSMGKDLYVLPSSVHEAFLIPADSPAESGELQEIVRDVNMTVVAQEDFLSDNVYYYDREKNELRIAGEADVCVKL